MELNDVKNHMKRLCQTKKWRELVNMIEEGYKGTFVILRIVDESESPVVAGDLAKYMNVSTARIANALKTLETKGYIVRTPHESDARKVEVRLTAEGKTALEKREARVMATVVAMTADLTEEENSTFFELLKKMLE